MNSKIAINDLKATPTSFDSLSPAVMRPPVDTDHSRDEAFLEAIRNLPDSFFKPVKKNTSFRLKENVGTSHFHTLEVIGKSEYVNPTYVRFDAWKGTTNCNIYVYFPKDEELTTPFRDAMLKGWEPCAESTRRLVLEGMTYLVTYGSSFQIDKEYSIQDLGEEPIIPHSASPGANLTTQPAFFAPPPPIGSAQK